MQRNRNDEVRGLVIHQTAHSFQSQERERIPQVCELIVLEGMDQVAYRPFIEEVRPGRVKMGRMCQARAAAVIAACPGKRYSAEGAERRGNERQAIAAGRADMEPAGIRDVGMADVTDRRKNDVKERVEEPPG